jgi:hypothetical protein
MILDSCVCFLFSCGNSFVEKHDGFSSSQLFTSLLYNSWCFPFRFHRCVDYFIEYNNN